MAVNVHIACSQLRLSVPQALRILKRRLTVRALVVVVVVVLVMVVIAVVVVVLRSRQTNLLLNQRTHESAAVRLSAACSTHSRSVVAVLVAPLPPLAVAAVSPLSQVAAAAEDHP